MRLLVVLLLCMGCASVHVETYNKTTGQKECSADYSSVFKTLEGVKMSACHAKGEAASSTGDVETMKFAIGMLLNVLATMPK